jgi:Tol biopolymer transport system component
MRTLVCGAAAAVCVCLGATVLHAQLPADARWHERESTHFRITYEPDLQDLAAHAAAAAERAYAALGVLVGDPPRGRIDIVIADNIDLSNGYATPFPSNRIVIYARPPVDVLELQYTRDWMELVITHELAHTFHLDATGGLGRVLRAIFGRVPVPWPLFPAVGTPSWNVEGLAVGVESAVTGFGRVHGSYHDMVVRTAALAGRIDEYDRLGSASVRWPGQARVYIYGSLFMDYLARTHGVDAAARIVGASAGAVIPPPLWFDRVGQAALGTTFREAYRSWQAEVTTEAEAIARAVSARGVTRGEPLTTHRAIAWYPRFSRDGSAIAYAAYDWRTPPRIRAIRTADGAQLWSATVNAPAAAAWLDADRVLAADPEFVDRFRIFSDLHVSGAESRQLTTGARLQEPDIAPDGRVIAVQNDGGTNRLVLLDATSGSIRVLTPFDRDVHWALPRFSPDGRHVAVGRWSTGGAYHVVVVDTIDATTIATIAGPGINAAPAWSPDGRWILFWSDRSGIPNIYAADVARYASAAAERTFPARDALRQVTNVVTGAYFPDVSPDGRWIAYSRYEHDGFRIERIPFDPAAWGAPVAVGAHADAVTTAADSAYMRIVAHAYAVADTSLGPPRPYRARRSVLPTFWAPVPELRERNALYLGVWSFGRDLVERHSWDAHVAVAPGSGRSRGQVSYTYRGLPELRALHVHPSITLAAAREWDQILARAAAGEPFADEREDVAAIALGLTRQRWRSAGGAAVAAELIRRSRVLYDAPDLAFSDPDDALHGARVTAFHARYHLPPLAISREDGFSFQLTARQRWDSAIRTVTGDDGSTRVFDGSYRELTGWGTAYVALPAAAFARHVVAARASGLLRVGPGASLSSIGGAGTNGVAIAGLNTSLAGSRLLLPVRGFPRGVRAGTHAWTASLEYRLPLTLIDAPVRPFFLDRLSAAFFADAGHAWCDVASAARLPAEFCPSTAASDSPLIAAGVELTLSLGMLGINAPLRGGAALPLHGSASRTPRFHILTGHSF